MEGSYNHWLRPMFRLRAIALALRVGLAFAAAHVFFGPVMEAFSAAAISGTMIS